MTLTEPEARADGVNHLKILMRLGSSRQVRINGSSLTGIGFQNWHFRGRGSIGRDSPG